ncbi:conjugal transfer protein TrbL family protein [Sporolactobacillus terrae]|uniref:conjugal transfer protein TrbL family protein n=1 Tax=Sporolactobacillus terrae TaxID=269673 RepID=UPI001CC0486D|nr:conjugal transfer protein TrbL family protein [Sporolactobacillus terrae]UAK18103.1 conjugal transfer protein TraL [Sporolactobacillus terrae]
MKKIDKSRKRPKWLFFVISILLIVSAASVVEGDTALAKTGDIYTQNKKVFDKAAKATYDDHGNKYKVYGSNLVGYVKKYDPDTNSFSCSTFDFACKISGFFDSMSIGLLKSITTGIGNSVVTPSTITKDTTYNRYESGLKSLSWTMLGIFLMWQIVKIQASRFANSEDGPIALNDKLVLVGTAGIILGIYPNFFTWMLNFQSLAVKEVGLSATSPNHLAAADFLFGSFGGLLFGLILSIILLILSLVYSYRYLLFALLYITGVIAIPTMVNNEFNYFSVWLRTMINNGVTLFLQILCYAMGMAKITDLNALASGNGPTSFFVGLGFFILALVVPGLLGQLGASTGTARGIGRGATALLMMRR